MKRRSFLKSAAALFPASGLEAFALTDTAASPAADGVHLIPAGEDRLSETHTLGFSTIRFKVLPRETSNGLFIIEHMNLTAGGPPLHLHLYQEEYFYVVEGEGHFQVGDTRKTLKTGDSILAPRGIPHTFAAAGGKPNQMLIAFTPAGKMEQFFRDSPSFNTAKPDRDMWRRYDIEYVGPSPFTS
jgi:quercetin dioxygenase-like cupin family protein